jgi:hypothetical protein
MEDTDMVEVQVVDMHRLHLTPMRERKVVMGIQEYHNPMDINNNLHHLRGVRMARHHLRVMRRHHLHRVMEDMEEVEEVDKGDMEVGREEADIIRMEDNSHLLGGIE